MELEKSGEDLLVHFPITIATVPFRIPNADQPPKLSYGKKSKLQNILYGKRLAKFSGHLVSVLGLESLMPIREPPIKKRLSVFSSLDHHDS